MIRFQCEHCGKVIVAGDDAAGKTGKCRACGKPVRVPGQAETDPIDLPDPLADEAPDPAPDDVGFASPPPRRPTGTAYRPPPVAAEPPPPPAKRTGALVALAAGGLVLGAGIGYFAGHEHARREFADALARELAARRPEPAPRPADPPPPPVNVPLPMPTAAAPQEPEPEPEPPASKPAITWTSSSQTVHSGDMDVKIMGVQAGSVRVHKLTGGGADSTETYLSVRIRLRNQSATKKFQYTTWNGGSLMNLGRGGGGASLTDDNGNTYKPGEFGLEAPMGMVLQESIYPRKELTDVLLFEPPVPGIKYLNLELPAENFGGSGSIRFHIPASEIKK